MISPICIAFPNKPSQCQSMAKFVQSINPLPIRQYVPNLMPIQCQCKWPFRSYSGNKLSTGTHHWSRRRMIWVNQFPIRHYTNPLQCQSWSTQFQSCVNPGQSSVNTPQFRYQSGRHLGQSIANPLSVPDKSAHVWPTHQSNANIGLICQSRVNPPIQCQSNTNPPIHYQSANPIPIRQSNTNLPMHYQSANPIPICQSNTNPRLNRQSITNMPIHYQSANPLPICQYITNPPIQYQSVANLSIHYQFANLWPIYQSQTNPFILCQRLTRLTWQSSNNSPSTHTSATTIETTLSPVQSPILANPMSMHLAVVFLHREQVIYWDPTTGLDGGWFGSIHSQFGIPPIHSNANPGQPS